MGLLPDFEKEILLNSHYERIVGIDEAGRGCWAGPVAVGAYILDLNSQIFDRVNDSKKLSTATRNALFKNLKPQNFVIKFGSNTEIDTKGITTIIIDKIYQVIQQFRDGKTLFLIDGRHNYNFGVDCLQVLKGDSKFYSIALASIVAKVSRDNLMIDLSKTYKDYNFAKHKGYGTKSHLDELKQFGACAIHRKSFKPVLEFLK
ncbi:MAG: ribonuclease HII [Candidatus Dojkabacteria bacterium]|nr:MAG: ribonuclease HII [Candidatus Dojkabacteria bacterium]GIW58786.1 MAG: ribonuclease HII [Candidatus Dojkabacteria bacterium]